MHNFLANLDFFLDIAKAEFGNQIDQDGNFYFYPKEPKVPDIQIIAIVLLAEAEGIDSENLLYARLKAEHPAFFCSLPHRTNFNRRKRRLRDKTDELSALMAAKLQSEHDVHIIDSMPLPVCRFARYRQCRIMHDDLSMLPKTGYQPIDKQYFFGYKLHALVNDKGLIISYYLSQANVHDVKLLKDITLGFIQNTTLLADKGYISRQMQLDLFDDSQIALKTPPRKNMPANPNWKKWMGKLRKRVETVFSQHCDQFFIKRNYAKSFNGFFTRITSKIAAYTLLQYINHMANKPIGQVKHALLS